MLLLLAAMLPTTINCVVRYEDCALEIAVVEKGIEKTPELATLRRQIDAKLARLGAKMTREAASALGEDERRYRRSLRRDLFGGTDRSTLDDEELASLQGRLKWRLGWLNAIILKPNGLAGHWRNASGEIVIQKAAPGRYWVSVGNVELDFLKWTCEFSGTGEIRNGVLRVDIGEGEQLELKRVGSMLRSTHHFSDYSRNCGANGHANGAWFSSGVIDQVDPPVLP